ncbi:MAG: flavodoxin [Clostridiaceae bacterium]|nr:flavodoxin [Clostridiaceae bacterium]
MKTAIVYYSMSGNVKSVAEKLSVTLNADLIEIKPVKAFPDKGFGKFFWGGKSAVMGETPELEPYSFNADEYETVIIGSPIWASSFAPPVRTFLCDNRDVLRQKKLAAFFCQSGNGADKAEKKMCALLGIDSLSASLVLIDPLTKTEVEYEAKIKAFAENI